MKVPFIAAGAVLLAVASAPAHALTPDFSNMSLADTLDFLRGAVMSQGVVAWQGQVHDSSNGQDWTYTRSVQSSNFALDTANCQFTFHYKVITNGQVSTEVDGGIPFRMVVGVETTDEGQRVRKQDAQAGHMTWNSVTAPEIYVVDVIRSDGQDNVLSFYDKGIADQAADAIEHARTLCR